MTATSWQVSFPQAWALLPAGAAGQEAVDALLAGLGELGPEASAAVEAQLRELARGLHLMGADGFASLVLPTPGGPVVSAVCALTVLDAAGYASPEAVTRLAEARVHPVVAVRSAAVDLPLGPAVRSASERLMTGLADVTGAAPFQAEIRYVVPLTADRLGVLHFATSSVAYLDELSDQFAAIAETLRVA